jgi:catechol 2,3-dioxygenase-like lactoylglutathione lyase family enzyme
MLNSAEIVAFVPTTDGKKSRAFYEGVLGLRVVSEDNFALVLDAHGTMLRVTKVGDFKPQQFTILGWQVPDIRQGVSGLRGKGVKFEQYGMPGQDREGIWTSPSAAKVAWFKDPDGNVLSITEVG